MIRSRFFRDPNVGFNEDEVGPEIVAELIREVIVEDFAGKEDFVQFYACHNGGGLAGQAHFYRDLFFPVQKDEYNFLYLSWFYPIPAREGEELNSSMLWMKQLTLGACEQANLRFNAQGGGSYADFVRCHIPLANDGSGNKTWLHIPSGRIQHVNFEFYEDGPIEVAPSFIEFVSNIVQGLRPEDRFS